MPHSASQNTPSPLPTRIRALRRHRRTPVRRVVGVVVAALLAACGQDAVEPDPGIAPLVGDWEATSVQLTNLANPAMTLDLIDLGATFTLNVQPSGQYTAILVFQRQGQTEIGTASVSGNTLTLQPDFPPGQPSTSGVFSLEGDRLTLDGTTQFDFNLDGTPEPASVHFEFRRAG